MDRDELFAYLCGYAIDTMEYEDYHSMGLEGFHEYVRNHFIPVGKDELVAGKEYPGHCGNACRAVWNGKEFICARNKYGAECMERMSHFSDGDGRDVFVPVREV